MPIYKWNVYIEDINSRKIVLFNVFDHRSFSKDVETLLNKHLPKELFSEELKQRCMYYFWSKCEWEIVISSWPVSIDAKEWDRIERDRNEWLKKYKTNPKVLNISPTVESKIDVYRQLEANWAAFVDYLLTSQSIHN